jgi:hypothetical protein
VRSHTKLPGASSPRLAVTPGLVHRPAGRPIGVAQRARLARQGKEPPENGDHDCGDETDAKERQD